MSIDAWLAQEKPNTPPPPIYTPTPLSSTIAWKSARQRSGKSTPITLGAIALSSRALSKFGAYTCPSDTSPTQSIVSCLSFDPWGALLASGRTNGNISIYDHDAFLGHVVGHTQPRPIDDPVIRLVTNGRVEALAWHGSGKDQLLVGTSTGRSTLLYDLASCPSVAVAPTLTLASPDCSGIFALASISGSKPTVAAGCRDGKVRLWDARQPAHPVRVLQEPAVASLIHSVASTKDGKLLLSGCADGRLVEWELRMPQRPLRTLDATSLVGSLGPIEGGVDGFPGVPSEHARRATKRSFGEDIGPRSALWIHEHALTVQRQAAASMARHGAFPFAPQAFTSDPALSSIGFATAPVFPGSEGSAWFGLLNLESKRILRCGRIDRSTRFVEDVFSVVPPRPRPSFALNCSMLVVPGMLCTQPGFIILPLLGRKHAVPMLVAHNVGIVGAVAAHPSLPEVACGTLDGKLIMART